MTALSKQIGYKLGKSTENNKALLFFSGMEIIQTFNGSNLSHYPVVCEVINLLTAMFENSAKIIIIIIIIMPLFNEGNTK